MNITMKGNPISLCGKQLEIGDKFPEFVLCDNELNSVKSEDLKGIRVFATVPSLDTGVCDMEIRSFNKKTAELNGVHIYAVSMDLPFAQARWCGAAGVKNVQTLSDYQTHDFGRKTGTLILGLELLTRAVFVVDANGVVKYVEYVKEVSSHPDYDKLYAEVEKLL